MPVDGEVRLNKSRGVQFEHLFCSLQVLLQSFKFVGVVTSHWIDELVEHFTREVKYVTTCEYELHRNVSKQSLISHKHHQFIHAIRPLLLNVLQLELLLRNVVAFPRYDTTAARRINLSVS